MTIDFAHGAPQDFLGTPLSDLFHMVASVQEWTQRHAEVLDYVYRHRVIQLLGQQAGISDLGALYEHLQRVASRVRRIRELDREDELAWASRWQVYADIIDARVAVLHAQERDPQSTERVLKRAHVQDILRIVASEAGIPQRDLAARLGLKKSNLTRILNLMEACQVIERRGIGRENRLHVGANAPGAKPSPSEPANPRPRLIDDRLPVKRGLQYLRVA